MSTSARRAQPATRRTFPAAQQDRADAHGWLAGKGYRMLFVALLCLLVVYPILSHQPQTSGWADIIVYLVLVAGVFATARSPGHRLIAVSLGLVAFASLHATLYVNDAWLLVLGNGSGLVFFGYLAAVILKDIFVPRRRVSGELVYGALCVYLLIGVAFAFVYQLFDAIEPSAFENVGLLTGDPTEVFEGFLYFSFVTMTTLGFGDIAPRTPQAGAFVTAHAIIGQMYLAVLVAHLVGLQVSDKADGGAT